eukprot:COSAG04_NODE_13385_length_608_cov_0.878193_1_plen_93_part_10
MLAPALLLLLAAAATTAAAASPPPRAAPECAGERLHNGICLPKAWPPRASWPASSPAGLIPPPQPPYLTAPPAVRDISTGRSLFIDDFLVDAE